MFYKKQRYIIGTLVQTGEENTGLVEAKRIYEKKYFLRLSQTITLVGTLDTFNSSELF